MAKHDRRDHPDVREFTAKIRAEHRPLIGRSDIDDLRMVMNALPALRFPVNSAGELLDQLGGNDAQLQVDGVPMAVEIKLKLMPAYYFPIVSIENFVEKMAELIRTHRKTPDVTKEVAAIRREVPKLEFPIRDSAELVERLGPGRSYTFQGKKVQPKAIAHRLPDHMFPISSEEDFEHKISALMRARPLVVRD
jgi:hypothetical protein